jgi:site-specific DNA-cytosine methylase
MPTHTEQAGMFTEKWVSMAEALPGLTARLQPGAWADGRDGNRRTYDPDEPSPAVVLGNDSSGWKWVLDTRRDQRDGETQQKVTVDRPAPSVATVSGQWQWVQDRPATTINGDNRVSAPGRHDPDVSGSQQEGAIRCTIAELATLQGFPPGYIFTGTKTAQAKQVGNAVPPKLAQVLAEVNRPIAAERAA